MIPYLQGGIDFSTQTVDVCFLSPEGQRLVGQESFDNARPGYEAYKCLLLETLAAHGYAGADIAGEATGVYWLPYFLTLADDPDLAAYDIRLHVLNPRWVAWYKKCFPQADKSDPHDAFYITDHIRTHPPRHPWQPDRAMLALRFYTRYRFHLVQALAREKSFFSTYLFLKANAYQRLKPFSDIFGVTSRLVIGQYVTLDDIAALPVAEIAELLYEVSDHHLPDPVANATKLHRVAHESFALPEELILPVQQILDATLDTIAFLEQQIKRAEAWITHELQAHPAICQLATIPGIGPVCSAGIGAEIGSVQRFLHGTKYDRRRQRERPKNLRDAEDAVAKFAGLWWPRSQSGSFEAEERHLAKTGNAYLRYYLIQAADQLRRHEPDYRCFYQRKYRETQKHKHKRALVLTARKSVALFVGLLHRNEPYRSKEERQT